MLAEGIASRRGRYGAYLYHDNVNRKLRARRGARIVPSPMAARFQKPPFHRVAEPEGIIVGTLMKILPSRAMTGDIILLGQYQLANSPCRRKAGRVMVEDAHGAPPSVPFLARRSARTHRRTFTSSGRAAAGNQRPNDEHVLRLCDIRNHRSR